MMSDRQLQMLEKLFGSLGSANQINAALEFVNTLDDTPRSRLLGPLMDRISQLGETGLSNLREIQEDDLRRLGYHPRQQNDS